MNGGLAHHEEILSLFDSEADHKALKNAVGQGVSVVLMIGEMADVSHLGKGNLGGQDVAVEDNAHLHGREISFVLPKKLLSSPCIIVFLAYCVGVFAVWAQQAGTRTWH